MTYVHLLESISDFAATKSASKPSSIITLSRITSQSPIGPSSASPRPEEALVDAEAEQKELQDAHLPCQSRFRNRQRPVILYGPS